MHKYTNTKANLIQKHALRTIEHSYEFSAYECFVRHLIDQCMLFIFSTQRWIHSFFSI